MTPVEDLTKEIRRVIGDAIQIDDSRPENVTGDPLASQTIDSIGMIRLLTGLEDRFRITIPPEEITARNFSSLDALVSMVRRLTD
jgi:acyl carrier protein